MTYCSWIEKINESNSRLHKEATLKTALSAAILGDSSAIGFLEGLYYCYNPFLTYAIKQIPNSNLEKFNNYLEDPWPSLRELLDDLNDRVFTGHAARDEVHREMINFSPEEWNNFCAPIMRRDMRCGISRATINKIVKGTQFEIPEFNCQLAMNCEGRPEMRGMKRLDGKLDGTRMLTIITALDPANLSEVKVECYSRNGKVYENFEHIADQLRNSNILHYFGKSGIVLDGEVMSASFQALMKQVRRKNDVNVDDVIYHVFDYLPLEDFRRGHFNAPLRARTSMLNNVFKKIEDAGRDVSSINLVPYILVDLDTEEGRTELQLFISEALELGLEGVMIKDWEAPYECDRSNAWLKYKPTITVDLKIIGFEEGKGKHAGRLGAMVCAGTDQGKYIKVNVGSGMDDQFRAQIWADYTGQPVIWQKRSKGKWINYTEKPRKIEHIGKTVEILADVITQAQNGEYSLRFPRFSKFRPDKD